MVVDQAREFLRDPFVAALVGGVLLTVLHWALVHVLRRKGAPHGR